MFEGKVGFAVGTGRCGTRFLQRAMSLEPNVCSSHERNAEGEAFHRYCKWYNLPIDQSGFFYMKEQEIQKDLITHAFSFEASAPLSLSIIELYEKFNAKFVLMVRRPEDVVNSYIRKGYYSTNLIFENFDLALGYQPNVKYISRFLGRAVPKGKEYVRWSKLSTVGKVGWLWNTINKCILEQFERIPSTHYRVIRLEDFTYECYMNLMSFFGVNSCMTKKKFQSLAKSRPNKLPDVPTIAIWEKREIEDFECETSSMAKHFGYPFRFDELPKPQGLYRNQEDHSLGYKFLRRLKHHNLSKLIRTVKILVKN